MPTVIDSLIVTLGLDPKGFTDGQKKAAESQVSFRKGVESETKAMDASLSRVRNSLLALFAAFTAGKGLIEFTKDTTESEASVGRFAKTLDTTVGVLSAWRGIAALTGGTAAGITGTIKGLVSQFETFRLTGESSVLPYFRAMGISMGDAQGKMKPFTQLSMEMAKFGEGIQDKALVAQMFRGAGIDEDTINVLLMGTKAMQAYLAEQKRLGVQTDADTEAGTKLQHSWGALQQASSSLGRTFLTDLAPMIIKVLDGLTNFAVWARQHGDFIKALFYGLAAGAIALGVALALPYIEIIAVTAAVLAMIVAFALLYDDWQTWMKGGKSLFGDFYSSVAQGFKDFVKTFQDGFAVIHDLFHGDFKKALEDGKKFFADGVKTGVDVIHAAGAVIKPIIKPLIPFALKADKAIGAVYAPANDDIEAFVKMGWTLAQSAGIVANIRRESGGKSNAVGDGGSAYGLAQWHKDRQDAFRRWAGHDIHKSTRAEQLAFINYELRQGSEKKAGRALARATTGAQSGAIVSKLYERPAAASEAATRGSMAANLLNGLASKTVTTTIDITNLVVHTAATTTAETAKEIGTYLKKQSFVAQANYGQS